MPHTSSPDRSLSDNEGFECLSSPANPSVEHFPAPTLPVATAATKMPEATKVRNIFQSFFSRMQPVRVFSVTRADLVKLSLGAAAVLTAGYCLHSARQGRSPLRLVTSLFGAGDKVLEEAPKVVEEVVKFALPKNS